MLKRSESLGTRLGFLMFLNISCETLKNMGRPEYEAEPILTVQTSRKVNVYRGRPAGHTHPDVSVPVCAGYPFHGQAAVAPACRHLTPACSRASNRTCRFLVKQLRAASLTLLLLACIFELLLPPAVGTASIVDHTKLFVLTRPQKSPHLWQQT